MTHEEMPDLTDEQIQELDAAMSEFVEYEKQMARQEMEQELAKAAQRATLQYAAAFDHFARLIFK